MSHEATPSSEDQVEGPNTEQTSQPVSAPTKKSRNPIERVIVWTLILGLVVFGLLEVRANRGYTDSASALREADDKMSQFDMAKKDDKFQLHRKDLDEYFAFWPSLSETKKNQSTILTYRWFSFLKDYEIEIVLDANKNVSKDDALVRIIRFPDPSAKPQKTQDLDRTYLENDAGLPMAAGSGGSRKSVKRKKKKSSAGKAPTVKSPPRKKPNSGAGVKKPKGK